MSRSSKASCWIITEGIAGTENQCLGLAEHMGLSPVIKKCLMRWPWRWVAPHDLWMPEMAYRNGDELFTEPFPDIVIAGGRKAIIAAKHIKKVHPKTKVIFLQDPKINPKHFDLVIAPKHDKITGDNVIKTDIAPNRICDDLLQGAIQRRSDFQEYKRPIVSVLIGGNSRHHTFTQTIARQLVQQLKHLQKTYGASLLITASRRTPPKIQDYLRSHLNGDRIFFWDGKGPNPYLAMLAVADHILVTEDSVSMPSEAVTTGKPVYIITLKGRSKRHRAFHRNLVRRRLTKPFRGQLVAGKTIGNTTMPDLAKEVWARLKKK